jgi:Dolichyl-phosphate-mannose-protein mannosyltransferase
MNATQSSPSAQSEPRAVNSWLLITLAVVFLLALPNIHYPIYRDQATYCVIAHGLLKGKQLYRDLWDNKPPGIFYIYTALVTIFGQAMWFVAVLDILWLLVIAYCIFRFSELYLRPSVGLAAAVLYTLWHERFDYENALQPETFIVLFVFAAWFVLAPQRKHPRLRHFAAGVLLALAFWTKYNAGLFLVLFAFLPYLDTSRLDRAPRRIGLTISWKLWLNRAAILTSGFASIVALGLAYFRLSGVWPALMEVQLEVLPRYATMVVERQPSFLFWMLRTLSYDLHPWAEACVAIALALAWRRREIGRLTPVLLITLTGFLVTASQLRLHNSYFETCLPFLAMVCAYVLVALFMEFGELSAKLGRRKMTLARVLLWIVFADIVYYPLPGLALMWAQKVKGAMVWVRNPEKFYENYWWPVAADHLSGQMEVIRYLKADAAPADQVFIWGTAPLIYYLTGREPPNRFVSNLALYSAWCPPAWRQELVRNLEQRPPRFIIVARHDALYSLSYSPLDSEQYLSRYPGLASLLARDYRQVKRLPDFVIYRRAAGQP